MYILREMVQLFINKTKRSLFDLKMNANEIQCIALYDWSVSPIVHRYHMVDQPCYCLQRFSRK